MYTKKVENRISRYAEDQADRSEDRQSPEDWFRPS